MNAFLSTMSAVIQSNGFSHRPYVYKYTMFFLFFKSNQIELLQSFWMYYFLSIFLLVWFVAHRFEIVVHDLVANRAIFLMKFLFFFSSSTKLIARHTHTHTRSTVHTYLKSSITPNTKTHSNFFSITEYTQFKRQIRQIDKEKVKNIKRHSSQWSNRTSKCSSSCRSSRRRRQYTKNTECIHSNLNNYTNRHFDTNKSCSEKRRFGFISQSEQYCGSKPSIASWYDLCSIQCSSHKSRPISMCVHCYIKPLVARLELMTFSPTTDSIRRVCFIGNWHPLKSKSSHDAKYCRVFSSLTVSAISSVASSSHALTSTILTSSNMTVATNNNQSYQLLFATVPKTSHPRIKYSGLKKNADDMAPLIVEAVLPANASNTANILDISGITPLMTAPLQQLSTITIPTQKNSQIINISSNDLSPAIKYADIDDIELPDGTKIGYPTESEIKRLQQSSHQESLNDSSSFTSNLAEKYSILAATALKNFDLSLNDSATLSQSNGTIITNNGSMNEVRSIMVTGSVNNESGEGGDGEELFACRHCGKKYRWKSTLRRHENDECGDKEPSHQCPYCPYKAKQRGNLGVHVRKHHANMPQLESRRKRKT